MTALERMRLERGARHLHSLGPRAVAELLAAFTARVGGGAALDQLLAEYDRLSPAMIRAAGADSMPVRRPQTLPFDFTRGAA